MLADEAQIDLAVAKRELVERRNFKLNDSRDSSQVHLRFGALMCLAVFGKLTDMVILRIKRRALRWRDRFDTVRT